MEIIEAIIQVVLMIGSALLFLVLILIVAALVLGVLGLGVCDIEYDEDNDHKRPLV